MGVACTGHGTGAQPEPTQREVLRSTLHCGLRDTLVRKHLWIVDQPQCRVEVRTMPKLGTWNCQICRSQVKEIGAFVKLSLGKYAHLTCFETAVYKKAWDAGREDLLVTQEGERIQAETERKRREAQALIDSEVQLRNYVGGLPRCGPCGRRMNKAGRYEQAWSISDVHKIDPAAVEPSEGNLAQVGVCANCVEVERLARNSARQQVVPAPSATKTVPEQAREHHAQFPKGCGLTSCDVCKALVPRPDRFALIETD